MSSFLLSKCHLNAVSNSLRFSTAAKEVAPVSKLDVENGEFEEAKGLAEEAKGELDVVVEVEVANGEFEEAKGEFEEANGEFEDAAKGELEEEAKVAVFGGF